MSATAATASPSDLDFDAIDPATVQDVDFEAPADPATVATVLAATALDGKPLDEKAPSFADLVRGHRITDDATFVACNDLFVLGKNLLSEIDAAYDDNIAEAHKLHKNLIAKKAKYYKPIADALAALKTAFLCEKTRRDQEAERQRLEAERALKTEIEAEATALAEELSIEGKHEQAAQVIEEARATDVSGFVAPPTTAPKLANVSTSGTWTVNEGDVDLMALVKAVAAGKAPLQAVAANLTYLRQRARADKTAFAIPGAKATFQPNVRVSR